MPLGWRWGKKRTIRKELLAWEENLAPTIWCRVGGSRGEVRGSGLWWKWDTAGFQVERIQVSGFSCWVFLLGVGSCRCWFLLGVGFPGGSGSEKSTCIVGDMGSIPGLGRSPGEENGSPLQCSCLENPHGQRSLVGYSPRGRQESDTTGWLTLWLVGPVVTINLSSTLTWPLFIIAVQSPLSYEELQEGFLSSFVSRNLKEHVFPRDGSSYRTQEVPRSKTRGTLSGVEVGRQSPGFTGPAPSPGLPRGGKKQHAQCSGPKRPS